MKKLFIISNESIYKSENKYFCDNLDMKSTPEGLSSYFEVNIVARKSTQDTNPYVFESFILANDIVYSPDRNVPKPLVGGIVNTNPTTPEVQLKVTHDSLAPIGGLILTTYALVKFNM